MVAIVLQSFVIFPGKSPITTKCLVDEYSKSSDAFSASSGVHFFLVACRSSQPFVPFMNSRVGLRNPLQAITSDLYLAKTELSALSENDVKANTLESLTEIEKNIDYINKIVADLQDYARPLNPRFQETNIKSIFNELLAKNGLPENIEVAVEIEVEAEKIRADPDFFKRIASNLTLNAVQAMPDGGKLTIHAYIDKDTDSVLIAVKDMGVGIPEDVKPKLFTPMMTTKSKGQGFGLAVVKRMTEGLGGTISFESLEGKGTIFIVRLPSSKTKR